jgi:dTDP-3-amino-3,4,6-trideoxy-alpha-D-glucose transaminase
MTARLPFLALGPGPDQDAVRVAIDRVLTRGWFILGPEVAAFEEEFAARSGAGHAVGVGTGTDAIALTLRAIGVQPGDEVITTPLSAAFSALAIMMAGARPVFADLDPERLTMDPAAAAAAVTSRTTALLPVHLYGQPADMPAIMAVARRHNLAVVEDACQAHLATSAGQPVGTFGSAGAFSFYPTKNLAALGDGGAVITNDGALAARLKRLRNGGQTEPYLHAELGVNSRLDELQAAVLRARLSSLPTQTARRRRLAARYRRALEGAPVIVPRECDAGHVYHLFPVRAADRDGLRAHLRAHGIGSLIHYPRPLTRQPVFAGVHPSACPVADRVCQEVCSLPLHPQLTDEDVDLVAAAVHAWRPSLSPAQL